MYSVHPGGRIEPAPKPTDCKPAEAALCLTKSVFATTVSAGSTRTTATSVTETCATITGCHLKDVDTTTKVDACTIRRRAVTETSVPKPGFPEESDEDASMKRKTSKVQPRAAAPPNWSCEKPGPYGIIWPMNPPNNAEQAEIKRILDDRQRALGLIYHEARAQDLEFTAFYALESLGPEAMAFFNSAQAPEVFLAYHPANPILPPHVPAKIQFKKRDLDDDLGSSGSNLKGGAHNEVALEEALLELGINHENLVEEHFEHPGFTDRNTTPGHLESRGIDNETAHVIQRRGLHSETTDGWHISMDSWPPGYNFDEDDGLHQPSTNRFASVWDDSYGTGQTVYILEKAIEDSNTVSLISTFLFCSSVVVSPLLQLQ